MAVRRGTRAASGVTSVTAEDPAARVVVRGPAGPQGPQGTTGPAGPTFNGGTVTSGITAPAFTLSATPTRSLDQRILRTVSPGLNPVAGTTYDLFRFNLGDLRGFFTVTLLVNGSGYGQSMEFVLPATYAMDWLQQGYGYTSGNNPFNSAAWVTLTPKVFTGRHLMTSATTLNLQAQIQANDLYFRLWLKDALTGTPTFLLSLQHDQGIENATVTTYTTTGNEAGPFPTLPNYITSKGGITSVYNPLGINTAAPAYPLDVNGQAIFRDRVGFYGTTPQTKSTVTGSRGGNAALTSLLQALAGLGLVTDGTTA